jgi:hypothetical protein
MDSSSSSSSSQAFDPRKHVGVEAERVTHVSSTDYPGVYPDEDHAWDLQTFKQVRTLQPRLAFTRVIRSLSGSKLMSNASQIARSSLTSSASTRASQIPFAVC